MTRHVDITVGPVAGGWAVVCDQISEPMVFLSGGRAEAQARALARSLSQAGKHVSLKVHDRAQALVGATRYHPCAGELEAV
jgi:hypothetical protein